MALQFVRFAVVGGAGVLVNMAVAVALNGANGGAGNAREILFAIPWTVYNVRFTALVWVVSFLVAAVFNYQLNRVWTFRNRARPPWWSGLWRFVLVGSVAAAVGLGLKVALTHPDAAVYLAHPWFEDDQVLRSREYWAQLIAILLTLPINFLVNRYWTFARER
ncbi:GtrA family protein [Serinibacter salmoneus]|uniref:GtrA family protein n=1 Tax=Serinibacter salmoneus TaxID=556530 RepID=UPI001B7FFCAD|nr:GtrA family protein [Serinibacter salmoneus]